MEKRQFRAETVEDTNAWREGDDSSSLLPASPRHAHAYTDHLTRALGKGGEETV